MLKKYKNPNKKGTVGVGHAISYFTRNGFVVSIPLNDTQPYDLVVEIEGVLKKVQIKTTTSDTIALRTMGGNRSINVIKMFDHSESDYVYGLMDTGDSWLIPTTDFKNTNAIKLTSQKYNKYKL